MHNTPENFRISILTPSFNQAVYLEDNIRSVLNQNYVNFEHIIIDGGSMDETENILKQYPHLKWVSEKDDGQADALNKGLALATGDIVGWINSDDYYEPDIFKKVVGYFGNDKVQWIVGNITKVYGEFNQQLACVSPPITFKGLLKNPDIVRQQGTFFRKKILDRVGGWNPDYYMTMDYDLWVRLAQIADPKMIFMNLAYFRNHPDQKSCYKNTLKQISNIDDVLKNHEVPLITRKYLLKKKYWYVLKGFVKQLLVRAYLIDKSYSNIPLSTKKEFKQQLKT